MMIVLVPIISYCICIVLFPISALLMNEVWRYNCVQILTSVKQVIIIVNTASTAITDKDRTDVQVCVCVLSGFFLLLTENRSIQWQPKIINRKRQYPLWLWFWTRLPCSLQQTSCECMYRKSLNRSPICYCCNYIRLLACVWGPSLYSRPGFFWFS